MKKSLKTKLKTVFLSAIAITATLYTCLRLSVEEDYRESDEQYNKSPWKQYHRVETSMFFTQRGFSSMAGAVEGIKERECFWKYHFFTGGVTLSDITSLENGKIDGVVDQIEICPRFNRKTTTLVRTKDYENNKQLFDNANKQFAQARKPYIKRKNKLAAAFARKGI